MFKDILNSKDDKLIFDVAIRPFIIFCISVVTVVVLNSIFGKLSNDIITGYICCMLLNMIITYFNLCFIDIKKYNDTKEEEEK